MLMVPISGVSCILNLGLLISRQVAMTVDVGRIFKISDNRYFQLNIGYECIYVASDNEYAVNVIMCACCLLTGTNNTLLQ